jgi:hypothetical protein
MRSIEPGISIRILETNAKRDFGMPEIDKHALRIWRTRIREVLNSVWDPIGECPEDEYEAYVGKIAAMIRDDASDDELKWAEVEYMGLGTDSDFDRSRGLKVIAALRELEPPL